MITVGIVAGGNCGGVAKVVTAIGDSLSDVTNGTGCCAEISDNEVVGNVLLVFRLKNRFPNTNSIIIINKRMPKNVMLRLDEKNFILVGVGVT